MIKPFRIILLTLLAAGSIAAGGCANNKLVPNAANEAMTMDTAPVRDAEAVKVLQGFSAQLQKHRSMRIRAVDTIDRQQDGNAIQYIHERTLIVRRPDRLRLETTGDLENESLAYDGSTVTLILPNEKAAGRISAPPTIDAALHSIAEKYGIRRPMLELASTGIAERIEKKKADIRYIGLSNVNGMTCDHIMLSTPSASWQLWIDHDSTPELRRLVVQYKDLDTQPRYTLTARSIEYDMDLPDSDFELAIPADAEELKFVPIGGK